jgi:hypothetical protein
MFANLNKSIVIPNNLTVLGTSAGDFQSGTTLAEALARGEKASISLLVEDQPAIIAKLQELDQGITDEVFRNFKKMWPKANVPDDQQAFEEAYEYISPLKASDKYGMSIKLSLCTKDGKKFTKTKAYVVLDNKEVAPFDLVDITSGCIVTPKINMTTVWVYGKKYGPKYICQELLMKGKSARKADAVEAGVFDVDDDDAEPATKKTKTYGGADA